MTYFAKYKHDLLCDTDSSNVLIPNLYSLYSEMVITDGIFKFSVHFRISVCGCDCGHKTTTTINYKSNKKWNKSYPFNHNLTKNNTLLQKMKYVLVIK